MLYFLYSETSQKRHLAKPEILVNFGSPHHVPFILNKPKQNL